MFLRTFLLRLKLNVSSARGIASLLIALTIAIVPFIGLSVPDAAIPIGWIDEDGSEFSTLLRQRVEEIGVLYIDEETDEDKLIGKLQTGQLEGVLKIPKGFEDTLKEGEYEETLVMLTSPYSTAFEVVAESIGRKAMEIWVACYCANLAGDIADNNSHDTVFEKSMANESEPILVLTQLSGRTDIPVSKTEPIEKAAYTSLYLLCAFACFYILAGPIGTDNSDFRQRLLVGRMSIERYRFALSLSDAAFLLPCLLPSLIGFGAARQGIVIPTVIAAFALYLIAYGGVASLLCRIRNKTTHMLTLTLVVIINLFLGSMLLKLPAVGIVSTMSYLLPSRWISAMEQIGSWCLLGLLISAAVYNTLPFVFRKRED